MAAYAKLFTSILNSTVWREDPETKVVWITLLAMADRNGEVMASVPGLADRARVTRPACEKALRKFLAPDRDSRTKNDSGRRLEEIDGGWLILNYAKYREMGGREDQLRKAVERQQRYRKRLQESGGLTSRLTPVDGPLTVNSSPSPSPSPPPGQIRVGSAPLPRPRGKPDRLVAATDAKVAELRAIADKPLTPEEVEALRALRTGVAG